VVGSVTPRDGAGTGRLGWVRWEDASEGWGSVEGRTGLRWPGGRVGFAVLEVPGAGGLTTPGGVVGFFAPQRGVGVGLPERRGVVDLFLPEGVVGLRELDGRTGARVPVGWELAVPEGLVSGGDGRGASVTTAAGSGAFLTTLPFSEMFPVIFFVGAGAGA
jgi:hypothetical protein